ncbi:MAG: pentapeptide repeat-containing protein [Trichodesmium sp.]
MNNEDSQNESKLEIHLIPGDQNIIIQVNNTSFTGETSKKVANLKEEIEIEFIITGSIKNTRRKQKVKAIQKLIQELGCDPTLVIDDVDEGSLKFVLKGYSEGLKRIEKLFNSGELTEIFDVPIESVEFIEPEKEKLAFTITGDISDTDLAKLKAAVTGVDEKELLIRKIITHQGNKKLNLSGADLIGADLSGANFSKVYFSRANLRGANLSRANLSGANLRGADLGGADLGGANLSGVNLIRADLGGANLSGANLRGANLSGANLSGANLIRADLSGANLSGADLSGVVFSRDILSGAVLSEANLSGANLSGANLSGANLIRANLKVANLIRADLIRANLIQADLIRANLRGANLSESYLIQVDLSEVRNIFPEQIKQAKNWESSKFDEEMKAKLGL